MSINTRTMRKTFAITSLMSALLVSPVYANTSEQQNEQPTLAEQKKTNENIGFGTGLVVGAVVAGPIGAIVSSVVGVLTANHINVVNEKELLVEQLDNEKQNHQMALTHYQQKMKRAEQTYQQELLTLQQQQHLASQLQAENLLMSLQFSTGSSELKAHYQPQIAALAKLLKQSPDLNVDLSGYTDLQGSDELNHALSIARVNSVKQALIEQGVQAEKINLFAYGEQAPVVANNERQVSFYDRRVVIKLQPKGLSDTNQQTVSNH
ncbi:sortase-associated OmpA-like protein PdsO [Thalassotalea sp. G2M2-11]|uniref:sortase-associated OmpA-like protein PdsO n=1 Tax=Thalassotalea sp. G2M2-11 TaxID=2787627 RepID=UPI0019CF69E5|nr:sortase-associated OmpA-like protein PdsO [Thalassotalea sp. G2M2-11]